LSNYANYNLKTRYRITKCTLAAIAAISVYAGAWKNIRGAERNLHDLFFPCKIPKILVDGEGGNITAITLQRATRNVVMFSH
jgi:hypothetical protein